MTRNRNTAARKRPTRKAQGKRPAKQHPVVRRPNSQPQARRQAILGPIGGIAGTALGAYLGGPAGAKIGGLAGSAAGSALGVLTGLGDYRVKNNVFATGQGIPSVRNNSHKPGAVVIRHKEYLGDIISSAVAGQFKLESYKINPALSTTFPWLSQIAQQYEEYEFQGLVFEFRSMSADALNSVNTALGTVIMATSYNVLNANFASKAEMDSYEFSNSCRPSESMLHLIECAPQQNVLSELYTRSYTAPSDSDARFYDLGNFQIATQGMQGVSVTLGEIWVSYQVALLKPKLFASLGLGIDWWHVTNTAYTNVLCLGNGVETIDPASTIAAYINNNDAIVIPANPVKRTYCVSVVWNGTSAACTTPAVTLTDCTLAPIQYPAPITNDTFSPAGGVASAKAIYQTWIVTTPNLNARLRFISATLPTGVNAVDIRVSQVPNVI